MNDLLSERDAAPRIGVAVKTLQNWRVAGAGPRFIKAGRRVAYDPADIEAWKAERRLSSTSQPIAA